MKNIKSFEELFPKNYHRYIKPVEKLNLSILDQEINDIIEESYGISERVIDIVKRLVEQFNDSLENGEYDKSSILLDTNCEIDIKPENYVISQVYTVDNFIFDTDLIIMNYQSISDDDFDMLSTLNVEASVTGITDKRFKLNCQIPAREFQINKVGIKVLNHKIMHAWQHHKKNSDGKKEKSYPEWNRLYNTAIKILRVNNDDMLSKAIYYADLRELAAYTQQAYQELKDIDISNDVHRKMRNLDIYKGVEAIKSTIDYLGENDLPDEFEGMIDKNKIINILKKRYYQYKKNIARLIIAKKEIIEEGAVYFDSVPLDGLYINVF